MSALEFIIAQAYIKGYSIQNNNVADSNLRYAYLDTLKIFGNTLCIPKNYFNPNVVITDFTTKGNMPCLGEPISENLENN